MIHLRHNMRTSYRQNESESNLTAPGKLAAMTLNILTPGEMMSVFKIHTITIRNIIYILICSRRREIKNKRECELGQSVM